MDARFGRQPRDQIVETGLIDGPVLHRVWLLLQLRDDFVEFDRTLAALAGGGYAGPGRRLS